jgi:hypothetical protein
MSVRAITVQDASVKTMTVEIKSMVVSGKQMTLAVFRQLPLRELIVAKEDADDPDQMLPALDGVPWGLVNYYWKDLDPNALHIVWERDGILYRSLTTRKATETETFVNYQDAVAWRYGDYILRQIEAGELSKESVSQACYLDQHWWMQRVWFSGGWMEVNIAPDSDWSPHWYELQTNTASYLAKRIRPLETLDNLRAGLKTDARLMDRWRDAYDAMIADLASLDQLYIAV